MRYVRHSRRTYAARAVIVAMAHTYVLARYVLVLAMIRATTDQKLKISTPRERHHNDTSHRINPTSLLANMGKIVFLLLLFVGILSSSASAFGFGTPFFSHAIRHVSITLMQDSNCIISGYQI